MQKCYAELPQMVNSELQVILDMSRAASMTDMRPNRGAMMIQILQLFVREFFDQNPLSHLSIMMLRNGRAERLTDLSGSPVSPLLLCRSQLCLSQSYSCTVFRSHSFCSCETCI